MEMNILIAEDDLISRMMLQALLEKWGYEVEAAADGNEAWVALQRADSPRLVILDRIMPGIDGVELCKRTRELPQQNPPYIILLTACGNKADIAEGLRGGADDYVSKPFDNEELSARLEVGRRVIKLQKSLSDRVKELETALAHIKKLQGILPICCFCHKIRDDKESWQQIESYMTEHSEAVFSHGICPDCLKAQYPELAGEVKDKK
jgi:phosphoserine phosphatase RsbU/P